MRDADLLADTLQVDAPEELVGLWRAFRARYERRMLPHTRRANHAPELLDFPGRRRGTGRGGFRLRTGRLRRRGQLSGMRARDPNVGDVAGAAANARQQMPLALHRS